MPYYVIIGALLLLILIMGIYWFVRADPKELAKSIKISLTIGAIVVFVCLMLTGKLFIFLTGMLAMFPVFNFIKNLWLPTNKIKAATTPFTKRKPQPSAKKQNKKTSQYKTKPGEMTFEQALEVLGLKETPSIAEIKTAHRNLIQKIHPDKGGSSLLAAQVNEAKDILLRYCAE